MLTDAQITRLWEHLLAAETRALYFGDLATIYTRRKQWIAGLSFLCSSGAVVTLLGRGPWWVSVACSVIVATAQAYTIALHLDATIATVTKLFAIWNGLATEYDRLWHHAWAEDAATTLDRLSDREREPSELAVSAAPHDERRMAKWQDRVLALHHVDTPA